MSEFKPFFFKLKDIQPERTDIYLWKHKNIITLCRYDGTVEDYENKDDTETECIACLKVLKYNGNCSCTYTATGKEWSGSNRQEIWHLDVYEKHKDIISPEIVFKEENDNNVNKLKHSNIIKDEGITWKKSK